MKPLFRKIALGAILAATLLTNPLPAAAQGDHHGLDIFAGVDFNYRDINYIRQWDVLLNLTPGFKWDFGSHWMLAGQAIVPIYNQYGNEYERIRPNMLVLSKESSVADFYLKCSAGLFSSQRYGFDLKAFKPMEDWVAIEGQFGVTGLLSTATGWAMSPMERFTWTIGGDIFLEPSNIQLRGVVGRFVYGDVGVLCEAMRHFDHTTVTIFGKYSDLSKADAGFRFTVMLPPYHRSDRYVRIRPASNFRFSNLIKYHQFGNRMYATDPEENDRDGWFSRDLLQWGSHYMKPDFDIKGKEDAR